MSDDLYGKVLGALPEHIAVVDSGGRVLATNNAWDRFAERNGAGGNPSVSTGADYLEVCKQASAANDQSAADALAGIRAVLDGRRSVFTMRYPCHSPREQRWFSMTVVPLESKPSGAVISHLNITKQFKAETELRGSEQRLRQAMHAANAGSFSIDLKTGNVTLERHARDLLGLPQSSPATLANLSGCVHAGDRGLVRRAFRQLLVSGKPRHVELRAGGLRGQTRWLACHAERKHGEGPHVLVGLVQDISEQKRREEQVRILIREVNHRSKNILGLVQAVARQTAKCSPDEFLERFEERIQSLSRAQDLLVKSDWTAVPIRDLVTSELEHFADLIGSRIRINGPNLMLSAQATQKIAMTIHELATNAAKYGALSSAPGEVHIRWQLEHTGEKGETFVLDWREHSVQDIELPSRRGFGSFVLSRMIEAALGASVHLRYESHGVSWRLACPASQVVQAR